MTPRKILIPVDFSYHANSAIRQGMALANRWNSEAVAVHVDPLPGAATLAVEPIVIPPHLFAGLHAEHDAAIDSSLDEIRADMAELADPGITVDVRSWRGESVAGIIDCARELSADFLVMGSQGASGLAHLMLGSTAEQVSRAAPCPVLIAGRADDSRETARPLRRVLAGIDYSPLSPSVARQAAQLVEPGGVVELVHIVNEAQISALGATLGSSHQDLQTLLADLNKGRVAQLEVFAKEHAELFARTEVLLYIGVGTAAAQLLKRAEDTSADLIVVGSHQRAGLGERVIGTVADRVLRYAPVPVVLCPAAALPDAATSAQ
ncbi:MAG: universal stress protein [Myxococcota bacterium]